MLVSTIVDRKGQSASSQYILRDLPEKKRFECPQRPSAHQCRSEPKEECTFYKDLWRPTHIFALLLRTLHQLADSSS